MWAVHLEIRDRHWLLDLQYHFIPFPSISSPFCCSPHFLHILQGNESCSVRCSWDVPFEPCWENLDRFLGRKNMLTHMLAASLTLFGGFSYAGIWAFYGLMQGLRESKSPQSHLFCGHVPYAAFFATEYFSASFIICRIRRWRCWRRGCWGRAWTVSFQCCLLRSTLSSLLFGAYGAIRAMGRRFGGHGATVQIKAGGPYAFLTHTLRVPYAKKHTFFFKIGFVAAMNISQPEQIGTVEPKNRFL